MRQKPINSPRQWWRNNPELSLAVGWAVVCGALLMMVRVLGLA